MNHDDPASRRESILRVATEALDRRTRRRRALRTGAAAFAFLAVVAGATWLATNRTPHAAREPEVIAQSPEHTTEPRLQPAKPRGSMPVPRDAVVEFTVITSRENALAAYAPAPAPTRGTAREPVIIHTLSDDDLLQALASAGHQGVALAHAPGGARLLNIRLDQPPAPKPPTRRGS